MRAIKNKYGNVQYIDLDPDKFGYAAKVKKSDKYGFIDKDGNYIIEPKFEGIFIFEHLGYMGVKVNGKWGIMDYNSKFLVSCFLDDIGAFYGEAGEQKIVAQRIAGYGSGRK